MNTLPVILLMLGAAVVVVTVFRRFNLPPILGYLMVGAAIGPHALNLVEGVAGAQHLAEFGIVFLMFSIGLEFSLPKLYAMKRIVFGLGSLQVLTALAVFAAAAIALGLSWQAGIALGGTLAMSSTAILVKLLSDRLELDAPHGREVIGVLLFQDLAVVPLLILIPAFSQPPEKMAWMLGLAVVKAGVLLAIVLVFGKRFLSRWFFIIARGKSAELFMLNVLLITLGLAWLTELAGLSMALGAFLAGMLISETEYRHAVEEAIKPFRDVLMGLFFIVVGMAFDLPEVLSGLPRIALLLALMLLVKFALVFGLSRGFGSSTGAAMRSGLWLCAGGEFGLVLLEHIRHLGLTPQPVVQTVLATLVISLLLTPLIIQHSNTLVMRFSASEWLLRSMQLTQLAAKSMYVEKHAVICGFGHSGQHLARFMTHEGVNWIALDLDPERVREATAAGESVVYGDATQRETLIAAGVCRANVLIVSFLDNRAAAKVLHHVREIAPGLPVVVRAADERDLDALQRAGADEVVPETLEAAMVLASHALIHLGVPIGRVLRRVRQTRAARYRSLRGFFHGKSDQEEKEYGGDELRLQSIVLDEDAFANGKTPGELEVAGFGVEITAVRRRGIRTHEPADDMRFTAGDVVVLLGTPATLALAEERMLQG